MADLLTQFAAAEGVSRENFNNRITAINSGFSGLQTDVEAAKTTADTALTNAATAQTTAEAAQNTANGKAPASHTHTAAEVGAAPSLQSNISVYVSTSGSDSTGDGTSSKPYATIAKALSVIPKNLNGYAATINIATGSYAKDVTFSGFKGGQLFLSLSGNVTVSSITIMRGTAIYAPSSSYTLTCNYIFVASGSKLSFSSPVNVVGGYPVSGFGDIGIYVIEASRAIFNAAVTVSNNSASCVLASTLSDVYFNTANGSNNTGIGHRTISGAQIKYNTGTFSAATAHAAANGGRIYAGAQTSAPNY